MNSLAHGVDEKKKRIVKLPLLEHARHRTKKSRFDAGVKCTVNNLVDAPSLVNASCSLYNRRPYKSCTKLLETTQKRLK